MSEIERMEKHLRLIRSAAGWSAKELGDKIGVTRQTINNIESTNEVKRSRLNKTQYIAIRSVLDDEIVNAGVNDTRMLIDLLDVLVDNPDKYTKEQRDKLLAYAKTMEASITSGSVKRSDASERWRQIVGLLGYAFVGVGLAAIYSDYKKPKSWLAKIINNKK